MRQGLKRYCFWPECEFMTTNVLTNDQVMRQAIRARAAALAGRAVGDVDKDDDAEVEFARLKAIDFSAAMAGRDFVDNLITEGHKAVVEAACQWLPFEMTGLAVGRGEQAAREALNELWGPQLDKALGFAPSEQEGESLIRDLHTALEGYICYVWGSQPSRLSRWKVLLAGLRPSSVTIGVSAIVKVAVTWRFPGRR